MPVVLHQFDGTSQAATGYAVAIQLATKCVDNYHNNRTGGSGGGIGPGSCWAAVAVQPIPDYTSEGVDEINQPFSISYGNSKMANVAKYVDNMPGEPDSGYSSHAERNALIPVGDPSKNLSLHPVGGDPNAAVMFVQLAPCTPCHGWLNGTGNSRAKLNPFAAEITGALTLHVWYRWDYDQAGVATMEAWNKKTESNKHSDIITW